MSPGMFTSPIRDWRALDPIGFGVVAIDGGVGVVDAATMDGRRDLIVVDVGDDKVVVPSGTIVDVDVDDGTVFVNRTAYEIETAPRFVADSLTDEDFCTEVARHFATRRAPLKRSIR